MHQKDQGHNLLDPSLPCWGPVARRPSMDPYVALIRRPYYRDGTPRVPRPKEPIGTQRLLSGAVSSAPPTPVAAIDARSSSRRSLHLTTTSRTRAVDAFLALSEFPGTLANQTSERIGASVEVLGDEVESCRQRSVSHGTGSRAEWTSPPARSRQPITVVKRPTREGPMNRTVVTVLKVLLILFVGYMLILMLPLLFGYSTTTTGGG